MIRANRFARIALRIARATKFCKIALKFLCAIKLKRSSLEASWSLLPCSACGWSQPESGENRVYSTTAGPLFSRRVARPRGHRAKKAMVYTIFLGKQGKRVYTIGPGRRVYTIEPQTRKKKKRRVSTVVVYTFFFPVSCWRGARECMAPPF